LKVAKVEMYNAKLKERQRRKDITREYKLLEKFFNVQQDPKQSLAARRCVGVPFNALSGHG